MEVITNKNMKKVTEKKERNNNIKQSLRAGASTRKLAKRYSVSNKRIWDIGKRSKVSMKKKAIKKKK